MSGSTARLMLESSANFLVSEMLNADEENDEGTAKILYKLLSGNSFPRLAQFQRVPLSELTLREMRAILKGKFGDDLPLPLSTSASASASGSGSGSPQTQTLPQSQASPPLSPVISMDTTNLGGYFNEQRDLFSCRRQDQAQAQANAPVSMAVKKMRRSFYDAKRHIETIFFSDENWIVCGDPDDEEVDKLKKRRALRQLVKVSWDKDEAFAFGLKTASAVQRTLNGAVKSNKERVVTKFLNFGPKSKTKGKTKGKARGKAQRRGPPLLLQKLLLNTVLTISSQKALGGNPFVVCPTTNTPVSVDFPRVVKNFSKGLKESAGVFNRHTEPTRNINDMKNVTVAIKNRFWG